MQSVKRGYSSSFSKWYFPFLKDLKLPTSTKNSVLPPVAFHCTLLRHPPTMICNTPGQCCQVLVAPPLTHFHWPTQKCGSFRGLVHFPKSEVAGIDQVGARSIRKSDKGWDRWRGKEGGGTTLNICDGACRRQGDGLKRRRYSQNNGDWLGLERISEGQTFQITQ